LPLPNNKSNVIFTDDIEEAHYLAAWVNSAPAQQQIARISSSTGITPKVLEYLPIPKFDGGIEAHVELSGRGSSAARAAIEGDADELARIEREIAELVLAIRG